MSLAFAAMMGWCGTKWPGWWRWPHPKPDPDPEPWWRDLLGGLIGAAGGIGAVTVFGPEITDAGLMGSAMTGFFGGVFLGSVARGALGMARG